MILNSKNKHSVSPSKRILSLIMLLFCFCTIVIFTKTKIQNETSSDIVIVIDDVDIQDNSIENVNTNDIKNNNDDIEIIDIVSYYQKHTLDVAEEINALSDEYVSFVIVTDTHGTKNKNNSQNIIRYLLKNTKANRLFHLGDSVSVTWEESDYKLYFNSFNNCKEQVFFALGNHEMSSATNDVSVIYEDLLLDKYYLHGSPDRFYYYFDDIDKQIRYLVINTSDSAYNDVTDEQITWISESVNLPSNDWKLVVFGHMDIMPNDPITGDWISHKAEDVTNALSSTNGTIIGYFCGHEHCDLIQVVNNKFYEVILLNDSCGKDTTFSEITNPERIDGTESEQAVSVVSINTITGDIDIRKIGAGENLTYNYLGISE